MSSVCHCRDVYGSVFQGPKSCFAHGELCAMANSAQLEILLQGVDIWNGWRKENPLESVDLRGADLSREILIGANFSKANLTRQNLREQP